MAHSNIFCLLFADVLNIQKAIFHFRKVEDIGIGFTICDFPNVLSQTDYEGL